MTTYAAITTFAEQDNRPGSQSYKIHDVSFPANTSSTKIYTMAPCKGKIKKITVQGFVTSDGTKTYTYVVTNKTASKTITAASQIFDADPVLTAFTAADLTLSTTAADVAVSRGDMIEIDFTGGTGSGATAVQIVYEIAKGS